MVASGMSVSDQINLVNWKDDEESTSFYESNKLYFDHFDEINDPDKIRQFLVIKLCCADAFYRKHHYDKVAALTTQARTLALKLGPVDIESVKASRHADFLDGMVLAKRRSYKLAYSIFRDLLRKDPVNDLYKRWYDHVRLGLYNWIFNVLSVVGIVLVLVDLFFFRADKSSVNLSLVGITLALFSFLTQQALIVYFKKKKSI